ncbi:family 2 encapsulin nanocompartment cargo protein terpene cyclase [Streptomyces albireticuli]|uniref:Terpene synthase n=1 Tax=Streptomyces albireticuli TaxID=1940 RepID=A0A2A2D5L2_9ACTN|nr:family 2 encapsulin nanocompartment cargo protein terpene cyclase [Streptomyces albireticuli]MCD9145689.1 2-methylisoborneol synthase [Streptomyces albireticuli]MCD9165579.1 2-methylisoborneol synthase [Streptomyces albireticuli]MCD9195898.1 2-methylisoborneol synthase [Streptomyces albireticuli]PAU46600.1 2-methylisoborneol synthase [Streptomyces albireticuli]
MPDPRPSPLPSSLSATALPFIPAPAAHLPGAGAVAGPHAGPHAGPGDGHAREGAAAAGRPSPAVELILRGPSGLGTAGLHLARREEPPAPEVPGTPAADGAPAADKAGETGEAGEAGNPIPGLYHHPVAEPDPVRTEEVSRRIKAWALDEVELYPEEWEDQFDGFSVGRYMVACHPDAPTVEHLMIATRLMVAENAVDDCYCEDHGGSPVGLGGRLLLAHTALDALHTTQEYEPAWARSLHADAPRRAYRSAMEYLVQGAGPSQADRFRHDMARLHMGYLAEAAWAQTDYVPEVWEYLAMRQFNNFRPCPTLTDTVGGYELPADLHARPDMQRVIALAGNATTLVNDLYSYTKELASPGRHLNLPVVIAEREGLSEREAYLKAVEVHNDLMHRFEAEAAAVAADCPVPSVLRFLRGVAVWVDGNHYWHQTNTYRYSLPDFW